ncbi:MAG: hypothetical protein ACR2M7_04885 [Bdellovibrionales bacterium]
MERKIILLISKKGQIFMEGLLFITCLVVFVGALSFFKKNADREIHKQRLHKIYKKKSYRGRWYSL